MSGDSESCKSCSLADGLPEMKLFVTAFSLFLLVGCETYLNHEVGFKRTAMNHLPPIEIDYSEMPPDWIELVSLHQDAFGNKKQVYRLYGPVRIKVLPAEDLYDPQQ